MDNNDDNTDKYYYCDCGSVILNKPKRIKEHTYIFKHRQFVIKTREIKELLEKEKS
jgi:hypothetical protein